MNLVVVYLLLELFETMSDTAKVYGPQEQTVCRGVGPQWLRHAGRLACLPAMGIQENHDTWLCATKIRLMWLQGLQEEGAATVQEVVGAAAGAGMCPLSDVDAITASCLHPQILQPTQWHVCTAQCRSSLTWLTLNPS